MSPFAALEDVQASAGIVRPAQLGALWARPVAAPRARCHLLTGGCGASCERVTWQRLHQASPQQRVPHLSEHRPPQQGGSARRAAANQTVRHHGFKSKNSKLPSKWTCFFPSLTKNLRFVRIKMMQEGGKSRKDGEKKCKSCKNLLLWLVSYGASFNA